jgi:hypothetical protein
MEVFNAIEHKVTSGNSKPGTATAASDRTTGAGAVSTDIHQATEEDFVFADNPEEDAAHGHYAGSKLTFSDDELSDSFRSVDKTHRTDFQDSDEDIAHHDIDESWAEAILKDDSWQTPEPKSEPDPEEPDEEETTEFHLLRDHSLTPPSPSAELTADEPQEETEEFFAPPTGADKQLGPEEPIAAGMPFTDLRREPLSVGNGNKSKWRTVIWSLIVVTLAGILIAQVTWFQFDRLSAIPELRPLYEKGCQLAGCHLKPLIDISSVQSRKLVVRTNPEDRTQLLVDAVIINRADFEQPFPAIALTFSNLNGDVVAQSVFTPSEYLADKGDNLDIMPKETPVRIAISIRDPGRDAVNYNIQFRPASR